MINKICTIATSKRTVNTEICLLLHPESYCTFIHIHATGLSFTCFTSCSLLKSECGPVGLPYKPWRRVVAINSFWRLPESNDLSKVIRQVTCQEHIVNERAVSTFTSINVPFGLTLYSLYKSLSLYSTYKSLSNHPYNFPFARRDYNFVMNVEISKFDHAGRLAHR